MKTDLIVVRSEMVVNIGLGSYCRFMGTRPPRPPRPSPHRHAGGEAGDDIAAWLRAAGLVPTPRRRQVLEALGDRRRPISAHELYVEMAGAGQRVGMSTVYRTLSALADAGLLHVFAGDGDSREARYRRCDPGRHYHLVCRSCGDVTEQPAGEEETWLERIAASADFVPDPRQTELYGVCGSCRRTARRGGEHFGDAGSLDRD
jgi:Fur family ferric uptake transcriptional regulator